MSCCETKNSGIISIPLIYGHSTNITLSIRSNLSSQVGSKKEALRSASLPLPSTTLSQIDWLLWLELIVISSVPVTFLFQISLVLIVQEMSQVGLHWPKPISRCLALAFLWRPALTLPQPLRYLCWSCWRRHYDNPKLNELYIPLHCFCLFCTLHFWCNRGIGKGKGGPKCFYFIWYSTLIVLCVHVGMCLILLHHWATRSIIGGISLAHWLVLLVTLKFPWNGLFSSKQS